VDYDELTTLQDYLGTLLEPDIDPTDVTAYANVYEMLGAQTAAALFDINDKTSLRTIDPVTGSYDVPVEGDAVDLMMDVSGTGGLTMEAYLEGATELVTDISPSAWSAQGANTVTQDGNENTVITYVDTAIGAKFLLDTSSGGLVENLVSGRTYQLSVTIDTGGNTVGLLRATSLSANYDVLVTTSGFETFTHIFTSDGSELFQVDSMGTGEVAIISNISVKALPGYVAEAASSAARPTLKTYNSPISSREILTTTYSWNITDGGRA
jgi:hypothetical protein